MLDKIKEHVKGNYRYYNECLQGGCDMVNHYKELLKDNYDMLVECGIFEALPDNTDYRDIFKIKLARIQEWIFL
jgi:hypothetical protein